MKETLGALRQALSDYESEVDAQLRQGGEEGLTDGTLKRWLVARKMQANVAASHIRTHAAWRAAWVPEGRVPESRVAADLAHKKIFLQGADRQGRPVLILQARKHMLTDSMSQQLCLCYALDTAIGYADTSINPDSKMVGLIDLAGLSYKNLDAVGLKNVFSMLQNHYVERLSKLYMLNAPSVFWGVWKMVKPFIDPVTSQKVVFLSTSDLQVLHQEVGMEVLPSYLGGTAELIDVQQAAQGRAAVHCPTKQPVHAYSQQQQEHALPEQLFKESQEVLESPRYTQHVLVAAS
eukprot:gene11183-11333_t